MLFNSYVFVLLFLPVVTIAWWTCGNTKLRLLLLTIASYIFYGYWDYRFTLLMLWTAALDYLVGQQIYATQEPSNRRAWVGVSIVCNLAMLGFFKYYDFFSLSVNRAIEISGLPLAAAPILNIVLPVGISFYTFQSMAYTIDIYRREIEPAPSFLHFACFVAMFHQLIAGPIVRYSEISKQLTSLRKNINWEDMSVGVLFFVVGMMKKLLIADPIATMISPLFENWGSLAALTAWLAMLGYAFQIYFDFSGYSDMAVGMGLWFGFKFPQNFNSPYKAKNISDFWKRWHITLSEWLRAGHAALV